MSMATAMLMMNEKMVKNKSTASLAANEETTSADLLMIFNRYKSAESITKDSIFSERLFKRVSCSFIFVRNKVW